MQKQEGESNRLESPRDDPSAGLDHSKVAALLREESAFATEMKDKLTGERQSSHITKPAIQVVQPAQPQRNLTFELTLFLIALLLAGFGFAYGFSAQISAHFPGIAPLLESYAAGINSVKSMLTGN
ncbi:MAG: hypothetical protein OXD33_01535 [Rhodobacteraceae bacterium]|nr:hypothetical protein [Paracoccaceae bacterium]